ncbi:MAG: protein kinase [Gemmatimonadales bacterium]
MTSIPANLVAQLGDTYAFERELVGGGMARVFLAEDRELHRRVVIKVLPPDLAMGVSAKRFRSEILTVAKLSHPHIVGILKAGEVDGVPYFVMPYVEGESLAVHLRRTGPSSIRDAVAVFRDVARALAFAHANGIVHRDIKPGNILLASGSATVTDFGVAKALSSALRSGPHDAHVTDTGMSLGTLLYMAPEQAANDPHIDGRADIYALGITIYEMLYGTPPFAGMGPREMLTARLTQRPPLISAKRSDMPARLEDLILDCLEPDPDKRPKDAQEVVDALESADVLSGQSGAIRIGAAKRARRTKVILIAAGVLAVIGLATGVPWYRARNAATPPDTTAQANAATPGATEIIVVLPFVSLSEDSSNSFLAEGLTNALASRLSRAAGLNVITPTRAVALVSANGPNGGAPSGRSMLVLEGAVERNGKTMRVTARLSDSQTGIMKWADVFDRDVSHLLSVEDEIAARIVEAVAPKTAPKLDSFDRVTASLSPKLYERFLRAKYDLAQRGPAPIKRSIEALKDITAQQPRFAPAFAALAQAYTVLPLYASAGGDSLRKMAIDAANTAVHLDSSLADGYTARAIASDAVWNWAAATKDFQRALVLDSMSAKAHQWYGEHLLIIGQPQAAVRELAMATRLDPASPIMAGSLALALVHAGRTRDAVAQAQNAVAMDPSFATTHFMYGAVLLYSGSPKDALVPLGEALELAPDSRTVLGLLGYAYAASGDVQLAQRTLRRIELAPSVTGSDPAIARIKVALGDVPGGFDALERAAKEHDPFFVSEPLASPPFRNIRSDPRFSALSRALGVTQMTQM